MNSFISHASFSSNALEKKTGFIAQEVEEAAKKAGYEFDGVKVPANDKDIYTLSYSSFVVPLVKAVQQQQMLIEEKDKKIEALQQKLESLQQQMDELKKMILHN